MFYAWIVLSVVSFIGTMISFRRYRRWSAMGLIIAMETSAAFATMSSPWIK